MNIAVNAKKNGYYKPFKIIYGLPQPCVRLNLVLCMSTPIRCRFIEIFHTTKPNNVYNGKICFLCKARRMKSTQEFININDCGIAFGSNTAQGLNKPVKKPIG